VAKEPIMLKSIYRFLSPKFQNLFLEYKVDFRPRFGHGAGNAHPQLLSIIESNRMEYSVLLKGFLEFTDVFHGINRSDVEDDENQPAWNNDFLPGLDIVTAYSLMRHYNPSKYVEVGSGNSTKVVRKAINDGELKTKIISVDPYPRANIDHLADQVVRQPVEELNDHGIFEELEAGDILFIDNSHRCLPNSDVTVCFLEILPKLKKGVIVHVHDIYMPFDYPQFMCDRAYSEQYVLAAFILANPNKYKTIMPNYFVSEDDELSSILAPIWEHENLINVERHGGSFWIEISE
jgi:hypothetical protein